jgi:hypothetical protein
LPSRRMGVLGWHLLDLRAGCGVHGIRP